MNVVAFALLAAMLATYALLDGYDLGVGAVVRLFARSDDERGAAIASIGPFWNGNEVWLIAAGGVLFAFFPLALILGVALGNLLRGLPLDAHGNFSGTFARLLNPYALAVGAFSLIVLAQ